MDVRLEHCGEEDVPLDRVQLVANSVGSRVDRPDDVEIVVTGDFVASVQTHTSDEGERQGYTRDRMFGDAAAKTLMEPGGSSRIIADLEQLHEWDPALLDRVFGHEGYHAAMNQRGECLSDLRLQNGLPWLSHRGTWAACAGLAGEEYRVERALHDEGLGLTPPYRDMIPEALTLFHAEIIDGITLRYPAESIERCCQTVLTAFHRLTLLLSYVAACDLATDGSIAPVDSGVLWKRLIGEHYARFRDALATFPSAATATPRSELDRLAFDLIPVLDAWLEHIGFEIRDEAAGLYFDVLSHDF